LVNRTNMYVKDVVNKVCSRRVFEGLFGL
jgi:hypothetical protein